MYNRLKRLYEAGKLTKEEVYRAVNEGWITEEEYQEIIGEKETIVE